MTPAERLTAAVARDPTDRLPACTYNCHPLTWGSHASDPGYAPILDRLREGTVAWLCKVSVQRRSGDDEHLRERRDPATGTTTVTWETPLGPLVKILRQPEGQPVMCVKHFLEDDEDIRRYRSAENAHDPVEWEVTDALARAREIGERGVAYVAYRDPFYEISELFEQEEFLVRCITDTPMIEELVEREAERVIAETRSLLDALRGSEERLLFYTAGPERATPPLLPPWVFDLLIVPHQRKLVDLIQSCEYPVCLHCHGRIGAVLGGALACGFDAIEPLEPPPQGDVALEDALRRVDGRTALMGYVQDQDLYTLTPQEVRGKVRDIARTVENRPGYVCCPTCTPFDHPPSTRYVENYLAFLDEAERV